MWDRREFMAATAMSGVAMTAGVPSQALAAPAATFVADRRFIASRAFAARTNGQVAWIEGDVTEVFNQLDLLWRSEKVAVSGLTEYGAFFCLERLGMDRGLRTAFREDHRSKHDGDPALLVHWMLAPKPARDVA